MSEYYHTCFCRNLPQKYSSVLTDNYYYHYYYFGLRTNYILWAPGDKIHQIDRQLRENKFFIGPRKTQFALMYYSDGWDEIDLAAAAPRGHDGDKLTCPQCFLCPKLVHNIFLGECSQHLSVKMRLCYCDQVMHRIQ